LSVSETRGSFAVSATAFPDFAEPVIGPANRGTRWLNPGYECGMVERQAAAMEF
jgi:hypothetical protein